MRNVLAYLPEGIMCMGFAVLVVGSIVAICERADTAGAAAAYSGLALIGYGFLAMLVAIFTGD